MTRRIVKILQTCKGVMDIRDYKLIFLQLLLYKYLSENESDYYTVEYPFDTLVDRAKSGFLKYEELEYAMYSIEASTERIGAYKVFEGIFDLSSVHKHSFDSIIRSIIELSEINISEIDINQLFEYLALCEDKIGGENTTLLTVGKLMLKLATIGLSSGIVLDQTYGMATMLSKVNEYLNAKEELADYVFDSISLFFDFDNNEWHEIIRPLVIEDGEDFNYQEAVERAKFVKESKLKMKKLVDSIEKDRYCYGLIYSKWRHVFRHQRGKQDVH